MHDGLPKISIVVPSLNQGRFLKQGLESIFVQNYPHLEVVIMDGGSSDNSPDIIREYEARLKHWQSRPDEGQSAAINDGMGYCSGDLVTWLNSDDFYWKDSLWSVGRAYVKYPDRGLYVGNGLRYNESERAFLPFSRWHMMLNRFALLHGLDYLLQPSCFILKRAWDRVRGLNTSLQFCMDWDLFIRITSEYRCVLINEFLSVSREYEETKTSSGSLMRAREIIDVVRGHTGNELSPGSLAYLVETIWNLHDKSIKKDYSDAYDSGIRYGIRLLQGVISSEFHRNCGNTYGFPIYGDTIDDVYLQIPMAGRTNFYFRKDVIFPKISVVTPSYNQGAYLERSVRSVLDQGYPDQELIVVDGGSTDESLSILKALSHRIARVISEPDSGPGDAINKGLSLAGGEILGWLNSDDLYAEGALYEVAEAFLNDPALDMVYGNALYIDERDEVFVADHGIRKTGLYYGEIQPWKRIPAYWSYVHSIPQPTVFFRRRLLEKCGYLNMEYKFIFDFELFFRFVGCARVRKIEKVLAFYRIHSKGKTTQWNSFEIELYRFSRKLWPKRLDKDFLPVLKDFVYHFMRRNFSDVTSRWRIRLLSFAIWLVAFIGRGNPEGMKEALRWVCFCRRRAGLGVAVEGGAPPRFHKAPLGMASYGMRASGRPRYFNGFCSYHLPLFPGHSGGEIRDFHLLKHLLSLGGLEFYSVYDVQEDGRSNLLGPALNRLVTPKMVGAEGIDVSALRTGFFRRVWSSLRRRNLPVVGARYHLDAASQFPMIGAYMRKTMSLSLRDKDYDFFFVSPQSNPLALIVNFNNLPTRLIMASYDVEAVRVSRLAALERGGAGIAGFLESRRAGRFEGENLKAYDGIIAVSEVDRRHFVERYGFEEERVVVVENGVDPSYFAFRDRSPQERPEIIFVGAMSYPPNERAAWRLVSKIMPIVWKECPEARLWIVGQNPSKRLLEKEDAQRIRVTGEVEDVRRYLDMASAACVPLVAGSGTKYKILEGLCAGVPMVCTPLALEGLSLEKEVHLLVGETDAELASGIVRCIQRPELVKPMTRAGHGYVTKYYAWDTVVPKLDGWLERLKRLPKRNSRVHA